METLSPALFSVVRILADLFDEKEGGPVNLYTVGAILSMVSDGDILEIVDELSFKYALQKLIEDKIVPIAHLIHEAFFSSPLLFKSTCPITMEDREEGLYLGGSTHCISLKDALHFFFKNGIRRPDGGPITEIRRVGNFARPEFVTMCQPIPLLKILHDIEADRITAKDVADFKNATIEDVEDGMNQVIEDIEDFQEEYGFKGSFVNTLRHISTENQVYYLIFEEGI